MLESYCIVPSITTVHVHCCSIICKRGQRNAVSGNVQIALIQIVGLSKNTENVRLSRLILSKFLMLSNLFFVSCAGFGQTQSAG